MFNRLFMKRIIASMIDMFFIGFIAMLLIVCIVLPSIIFKYYYVLEVVNNNEFVKAILLTMSFTVYYTICECTNNGISIGKKVLGLRVVSANGMKISLKQSILRNIFRLTDQVCIIGSITIIFDKENRRLGDIVSQTKVIDDTKNDVQLFNYILRRLIAYTIDIYIASILSVLAYIISISAILFFDKGTGLMLLMNLNQLVFFLVFIMLYYIIQETIFKNTIGKKILHMRVVTMDGAIPNRKQMLIRNILRITDQFLLIGCASLFFEKYSNRRFGDIIAGTTVKHIPKMITDKKVISNRR